MTKSSITFFAQEYYKKHPLTHEEVKSRLAILQYDVEPAQDHLSLSEIFDRLRKTRQSKQSSHVSSNVQHTAEPHQAIRDLFASLRQQVRETRSPHHQSHQGDGQAHATNNQAHVLEVPVVTEVDKAVLEYLQAYFRSDRSSLELLMLSNRLFKLGEEYNKNSK
ncbi:hypothetical protein BKG93_09900 [Rodentibacter ratti]|uniref:Uncharacterized protein n=1 Tax=Rodentibacter ratti TaxID=1906745 RepID=A0A1V3L0U6_9PAST|nr:hypothetical protein [Rodentibacter ratti]OOF83522.1 hypothetical protein BKG93_09900 [Rodentibacter ratti]